MQIAIGMAIVLALIYWVQGDATYIGWIAAIGGAAIGIPVLIGLVKQAGRRAEKRAEDASFQKYREEAAVRNAPMRSTVLAHVAVWRRLNADLLERITDALETEDREVRREALETMAYRLRETVKVDDPDPAFLPKIKLGDYELNVREETTDDWEKRYIYELTTDTGYYGDRVDGRSPVEDGPEKIWTLFLQERFDDGNVARVAREMGIIAEARGD